MIEDQVPVFARVRKITDGLISKMHVDARRRNKFLRKIWWTNCVVDFFFSGRLTEKGCSTEKLIVTSFFAIEHPIEIVFLPILIYFLRSYFSFFFTLFCSFFFCFLSLRHRKIKSFEIERKE